MFVYLLLCRDGSIYTGIAKDLASRMRVHASGARPAAAYTRSHGAHRLLAAWQCEGRGAALQAEYAIKRLSHAQKAALAACPAALGGAELPLPKGVELAPLDGGDPTFLAAAQVFSE